MSRDKSAENLVSYLCPALIGALMGYWTLKIVPPAGGLRYMPACLIIGDVHPLLDSMETFNR